jgi:hypothetical protein
VSRPGAAHPEIVVDDAVAAHAELSAAGFAFVSPPNLVASGARAGARMCYFRGPDGLVHELYQPPDWPDTGSHRAVIPEYHILHSGMIREMLTLP